MTYSIKYHDSFFFSFFLFYKKILFYKIHNVDESEYKLNLTALHFLFLP